MVDYVEICQQTRSFFEFTHQQLEAPAIVLSWFDDALEIECYQGSGVAASLGQDYMAIRQWDPISPNDLLDRREMIKPFSEWPELPGRTYNVDIYRTFLSSQGFVDDLNIVLSEPDGPAIAILSALKGKKICANPDHLRVLQLFLSEHIALHPRAQRNRRHRKLCGRLGLSPREFEVVEQLRFGASNQDIATALDICLATVKSHVMNAMRKTGVGSRARLVSFANRL